MKRTSPATLAVVVVVGAAVGFALDLALTAGGQATFTPTFVLPLTLIALAAVVIALALPIRRATRGAGGPPLDPFRAVRVAVLAKASSIVGAAMGGAGVGLAIFLLTRPVAPSLGSMLALVATAASGAVLIVAGLMAEQMCTVRRRGKDDDDDDGPGVERVTDDPRR